MNWRTLNSLEDASVNHTLPAADGGFIECRYVRRTPEYFICYLSSHTGCSHSCRFCHLTATKQTMMSAVTYQDYIAQAKRVFQTYNAKRLLGDPPAERVHFNFMARGEALSNPHLLSRSKELFYELRRMARMEGLTVRFSISTILPRDFEDDLVRVFGDPDVTLYYSLYSIDPAFRRRWLPKAMAPDRAMELLRNYQQRTSQRIVLHWAFIKGENDSIVDVRDALDMVDDYGLDTKFNLVRYNPHGTRHGMEPDEKHLQQLFDYIQSRMRLKGSRIVPRVGYDVKASCGMFITSDTYLDDQAKQLAVRFHDTYERLAPDFGYETREETRRFNPDTPNGRLMIAVCRQLIDQGLRPPDWTLVK